MTSVAESATAPDASVPITVVAHDVGGIGGMERQLEQLVLRIADAGREVTVIARDCRLAPHSRVRWERLPGPARPFLIAYPWFFLAGTILVLRARRRGIVHVTGAIVANRADVATVHLCHRALALHDSPRRSRRRSPAYTANAMVARWMSRTGERWCYRPGRLGELVGVSAGVTNELRTCFPALADRTTTIPNGVDSQEFQPAAPEERERIRASLGLGPEDLAVLFVGGEWEGKGLRFAIEAIASQPQWRLLVVGEGHRPRYEKLAAAAGAADRVRFIAPTEHILPLYQASDAFVLPSAYETFSLVMHEAAACALPLLGTRVSGVTDLLEHGVNGWFITHDGSDIASRLATLAADAPLRAAMGAAARDASTRYSWESMARSYDSLYAEISRAPE